MGSILMSISRGLCMMFGTKNAQIANINIPSLASLGSSLPSPAGGPKAGLQPTELAWVGVGFLYKEYLGL